MASGGWRWHKNQSGRNALGSFNSPSLTNVPEEHRSHFATIFSPLLLLKLLGHQANLILIVNHRSSSTLALWPFLSSHAQSSKPLTSDSWEGGIWSFSGKISDYAGITLCVRATQDKFTEKKKEVAWLFLLRWIAQQQEARFHGLSQTGTLRQTTITRRPKPSRTHGTKGTTITGVELEQNSPKW